MKAIRLVVLFVATSNVAFGQTDMIMAEAQENELSAISRAEIATLRGLAEAIDPAILGFRDAKEIDQAVLGTPIRTYMITLESLQDYVPAQTTARSLLLDTNEVTVPLHVGGSTRSGITLAKREGGWTPVSFGGANFAKLMSDLRRELASRDGQSEAAYFVVRIPALNVTMLGTQRSGDLFFASLLDDPRFKLTRGEMLPATVVLERLQPAAKEHNGLPT